MQVKHFLLAGLILALTSIATQAQRPLPPPAAIAAAPAWAQDMYGPSPNVFQVDAGYRQWRRDNPDADTYYSRYYRHWRKSIGHRVATDGQILPLDPEESMFAAQLRTQQLNKPGMARSNPGPWKNVGPDNTYAEGSVQEVSWQVNIYCIDQSPSHPDVLYAGTENGAIFRTADHAQSWKPVSDGLSLNGIGAIRIHPQNPDIVYMAAGNNVYKTQDGGQNWSVVLSESNLNASSILVSPEDPAIVLVAGQKGIRRSEDNGSTWTNIGNNRCWDLAYRPGNAQAVYALVNNPTTRLCEFHKSVDGGQTFDVKSKGWLDPSKNSYNDNQDGGGRLAVTPADPDRVYAVLLGQYNDGLNDNNYLGVFRSNNGGEDWSLPNANANGGPGAPYAGNHSCLVTFWFNDTQKYPATYQYDQGFYNLAIAASHSDPNRLLVGFLNLFKSEDGAATFTRWGGYGGGPGWQHPDIQAALIQGPDVWVCSDGGLNLYKPDFSSHESRAFGIAGSDYWGFDGGWNEDIVTGGRYHNGNTATILDSYEPGHYIRLGGAEASTGYVHPAGGRKVMHSDISPAILPETIDGDTRSFGFTLYPNEGYAGNNENSSEIEPHPSCYNSLYMGVNHFLMHSGDGGLSWDTLHTFGSDPEQIVTGIEISRSNPDVLYVVQILTNSSALWLSVDGGKTFTTCQLPPDATRGAFISLDPLDESHLWLAWSRGGNSGSKVFVTPDKGGKWTNLTSSQLNGQYVEQMFHLGGTDNGVYLATNFNVYYRSDSETDWVNVSQGLPVKANTCRMTPFYAGQKVRLATYGRGIFEAPFYETTAVKVVQPTVDKLSASCARDTFYFDDYSMIDHQGASWSWTFDPQPAFVSGSMVRNPKVVFGKPGSYTASMMLNGIIRQLKVEVSDACQADSIPGSALRLDGNGDMALAESSLNLNSNTVTLMAWIKPEGAQNDWSGLVFARGGTTTAGISLRSDNRLGYHWNDSGWGWNSGQFVPDQVWTHVALVITPDQARIYVNGVPAVHNASQAPEAFDTPLQIGRDNGSRYFKGWIDEVSVWKRALSQDEIRELMHHTLIPGEQPDLVSYYQFNEGSGRGLDKVASRHCSLTGDATRQRSRAPLGFGFSQRKTLTAAGSYDFDKAGVSLQWPENGIYPGGETCISQIFLDPDTLASDHPGANTYWILRQYGGNPVFTEPSQLQFAWKEIAPTADPAHFRLYQRDAFGEGASWGPVPDTASTLQAGIPGKVTFTGNQVNQAAQMLVMKEGSDLTASGGQGNVSRFRVFPNPSNGDVQVETPRDEPAALEVRDAHSRLLFRLDLPSGKTEVPLRRLAPGTYWFEFKSNKGRESVRVVRR